MFSIGFFPTCSFWPLCLQLGQGVMYIPGWRRTQGLLVGRATTGIESCPAQQVCLFLCNLLHFPSTLYANLLLWDKANCDTSIFSPTIIIMYLVVLTPAHQCCQIWASGWSYFQSLNQPLLCLYTHICVCICLMNPNRAFLFCAMRISRLAIVTEELVSVTWRRGGDGALLCQKRNGFEKGQCE